MFSSSLWPVMTIKCLQSKTNILALFKAQATAKASPSIGAQRLSVSVVNLEPANARCQPPEQHVGAVFAGH